MYYELGSHMSPDMREIQSWEMHPFMQVDHADILHNMEAEGRGNEELERAYKRIRGRILMPPFDKVTSLGAIGPSSSAKGDLIAGLDRTFKQDPYLKSKLGRHGVNFVQVSVPFTHVAAAARLPRVGIIPEDQPAGTHTPEQYRKISNLQRQIIEEHVLPRQGQGEAILLEVESSSPTSVPTVDSLLRTSQSQGSNVEVEGVDRGNSAVYSLFYDNRTRDNATLFALHKRDLVGEVGMDYRNEIFSPNPDLSKLFSSRTPIVFTNHEGQEVNVADLSPEEQMQFVRFLRLSVAPPGGVVRSDEEKNRLKEELAQRKLITWGPKHVQDDTEYYEYIRNVLRIPRSQFVSVTNEWTGGTRAKDMTSMLTHNIVLEIFPELLDGATFFVPHAA